MNTTAIARHLNVAESAITRCEEWARVLFVVVKGLGARFVSKKIMSSNSNFGKRQKITTPSGGWAVRREIDERWGGGFLYEVGSRMWGNGGDSIIGNARSQEELDELLEKAEAESAYSKRHEAQFRRIPAGYAVTSAGEVVLQADWDEIEGAM